MRSLLKLTWVEAKLFFREPQALFFTLIFPLILLFVYGGVYGNKSNPMFGGFGMVDVSVPSYTAMIIATSGLISISVIVATYREAKILRRFKATPLSPLHLLTADVIVIFFMTAVGMMLLVVVAKLVFGLRFFGNALSFAGAFVISCASFFSLGFILCGLIRTARTAQIVSMALFFPMILLSGATIPIETMPEYIRNYARFIPLTYVVKLLKGFWFGDSWSQHQTELVVLTVMFVVGLLITAKTFRWE
ncbi:MAG: ABC transporter permease [Candidatus Aminicenantes bacterium]|nr:ABC transporter permease [Candidatus Aminicenantes bacterium]